MTVAPLLVMMACLCGFGFIAGKLHERIQWNKLIQEGKLPRPRARA